MIRALALACLATGAQAEAPMTAAAFAAYVEGRTIAFADALGISAGVEQYLSGKRVIWSPQPGTCLTGRWYAEGQAICFAYDGVDDPACWDLTLTPDGLRAARAGGAPGATLFEAGDSTALVCDNLSS